jgi:hypothetical protein
MKITYYDNEANNFYQEVNDKREGSPPPPNPLSQKILTRDTEYIVSNKDIILHR